MNNQPNTASREEVKKFYNSFADHQKRLGINIRHRTIFKNLRNSGLENDCNVLEIGCGIGTVSNLILRFLKKGCFVGVDISNESIETAKKLNSAFKNAEFRVSDMSDFTHPLKFDIVVLPDVLEHIPLEQHKHLFSVIRSLTHPDSVVLINIPEPNCLNWARRHHPENLQIIDQSLSMQDLLNNVYPNEFELYSLQPYALQFTEPDYLSIVLKRKKEHEHYTRKSKLARGRENLLSKL
ncbi:MAG TPA: class I SAM-dependent methyltransferase [Bacteroidia bacterium]|nr:class I SAM-dependent methyltransferase [Bacteroidia bacterium]